MTARARLHRGVRIVMPGQLRPALAAAVLIAVGGCSSAPSRNILGSYFPSWMVCALVGLGAAAIMRRLLIKAGIDQELPAPWSSISPSRQPLRSRCGCYGSRERACHRQARRLAGTRGRDRRHRVRLCLAVGTVYELDRRPRTHNAHLFAYTAAIAPDVSGRIVALHATNNQRVSRGSPLVDIDPEPFELRVRQARAQVAFAAGAARAHGSASELAEIRRGRGRNADRSCSRATRACAGHAAPAGAPARQGLRDAPAGRRSAHHERTAAAALTVATQQSSQARQAVGDTGSLAAQLAGALAAQALAERDVRLTSVVAPFDGMVVGHQIAEGAFATTGAPCSP